jgi:molybdopterin-containing oxidoreductase family iron-sulfur binding subunit
MIAEGEMVTACQAACPTHAIHFGDLNRSDSDVSVLRDDPRHYSLLAELNTRPRTTYLKRLYPGKDEADER